MGRSGLSAAASRTAKPANRRATPDRGAARRKVALSHLEVDDYMLVALSHLEVDDCMLVALSHLEALAWRRVRAERIAARMTPVKG